MGGTNPQLSVVMPARNARLFLDESIGSIINQTFTDFEFIILDDASTDGTYAKLQEWASRDPRIRLFHSDKKLGLVGSSNFLSEKVSTPIMARMDADDVSHPDRLHRQWEVLKENPDIVAVGTLCDGIDIKGRSIRPRDRWRLVRQSPYIPFPHGSAMFRSAAMQAIGGYQKEFEYGEDQDFFFKMRAQGRVVTLPKCLYSYRYHDENATLHNGARAVRVVIRRGSENGEDLAAFYMLGAMRIWSGQPPGIFRDILTNKSFKLNLATVMALGLAAGGTVSPSLLRFMLRSFIQTRDLLAGFKLNDENFYEWRSE